MRKVYLDVSVAVLAAISLLPTSARSTAGDWPQILGPNRNGVANDESIADTLDANLHKTVWTIPMGHGFAGPAVVGERVVVFHRIDDQERVELLDRANGKPIWKKDFDAYYRGGVNPDNGPRCVPLVAAGKVILFGASGLTHALTLADGEHLWTRDLYDEYKGDEGYFGAGSTPIFVEDRVLFNVGGVRNQAGIVALNLSDGKTLWTSTNDAASYASPIMYTKNEQRRIAFMTRLHLVIIDPKDGSEIDRIPFGKRGPTVNAASPVFFDGQLFLTSSYGVGAQLLDIRGKSARLVWQNDTSLSSQYNTPIYHDGSLYGVHGREDIGVAELRCVSAKNGKVQWSKGGFGVAHLLLADEKLIALTIDGEVVLIALNKTEYEEMGRLKVASSKTRALPALSNGHLFLRDDQKLYCINVAVQ